MKMKSSYQSLGSYLSNTLDMPCKSAEAIARRKETRFVCPLFLNFSVLKSLYRKQTSKMRNERQRLYASVLRSTGRRKDKKSEKQKQIAQAKTTLMPPWYVTALSIQMNDSLCD
jgi:hypothetical protein